MQDVNAEGLTPQEGTPPPERHEERTDLFYVTPASPCPSLPSRPTYLLDALAGSGEFSRVRAIHRMSPAAWVKCLLRPCRIEAAPCTATPIERMVHPLPFGAAEALLLRRTIRRNEGRDQSLVLWIADPKSAVVLAQRRALGEGLVVAFDAYDLWDQSPLVTGGLRRAAVRYGYMAAAKGADLLFANTPAVASRLQELGARNVRLLQNGAPPIDRRFVPDLEHPYVLYVGRIHERVDVDVLVTVLAGHPSLGVLIAGPIEREPRGWPRLLTSPNVRLLGPVRGERLRSLLGRARALVIPHKVDDYTRSQDAMKAWDALAVGTPVVSTSVPPAVTWPPGLALVADDGPGFAEAVSRVLDGELDAAREDRFAYAAANSWRHRAAEAIAAIKERLELWD